MKIRALIGHWLCRRGWHDLARRVPVTDALVRFYGAIADPPGYGPVLECRRCGTFYRRSLIDGRLDYIEPRHREGL